MPRPYSSQNSHIIRKLDLHSAGFRFRCMRYNTSKKKTKSYAEKWNTSQKKTSWINIAVQPKFLHVYHLLRHEALILSSEVLKKHKKLKNATPLLVTSNFNIWCLSAHPVIFGSVFFNHPLKKTKKNGYILPSTVTFIPRLATPRSLVVCLETSPCHHVVKKRCVSYLDKGEFHPTILVSPTLLIYSHEWTELNNLNLIFCCPSWTETTSSNPPPQKNGGLFGNCWYFPSSQGSNCFSQPQHPTPKVGTQ